MMLVDEFSALLKRKMGLDSGSIGKAAVERAVRHRMNAVGVADEHEFLRQLHTVPGEMQQLIEAVIVPETWFFRYPESQIAMAGLARARLFAVGVPESRVLRILSVPCASGEEPYSIAMALLDAGVPAARFQVDAVDISERMVQFAQRAMYGRNAFRGDDLAYRDRHFVETADGHQLNAQVRERVRFQHGNLFDGNLLAGVAPYDFVFCRNLLIYFDGPTQERAVQVLRRFTRNDGVIFVGPAETSLLTQRRLPALPLARAFAFRAQALPAPPEPATRAMGTAGDWVPPQSPHRACLGAAPAARGAGAGRAPAPGACVNRPGAWQWRPQRGKRQHQHGHGQHQRHGIAAPDRADGGSRSRARRPGAMPRAHRPARRQRRCAASAGLAARRRGRLASGAGGLPQGAVPGPDPPRSAAAPGRLDRIVR
ncbi:Chemotaxis protein methyltransferase [Achromobacter denitrificans]|nr:Chemotaxis protein methyltransferase [Achromobacter denitrificans]